MRIFQILLFCLRKLLSAPRKLSKRSFRLILYISSSLKHILGRAYRRTNQPSLGITQVNHCRNDVLLYPSQVPKSLSPIIIEGNTPTDGIRVVSPIPITIRRPTADIMGHEGPFRTLHLKSDGETYQSDALHDEMGNQGYLSAESPAASVSALGVFPTSPTANGFLNLDDAIQYHDSYTSDKTVVRNSRPASPASQRSRYQNSHNGAEEFALLQSRQTNYLNVSPASTRPPSRAQSFEDLPKAPSMLDLNSTRGHEFPNLAFPRARAPNTTAHFRSGTPSSIIGNNRIDAPSPAHVGAQPGVPPFLSHSTTEIPVIKPCLEVERYDRGVTIRADVNREHVIQPLTTSFSDENLPKDWKPVAHPEGALYWVHKDRPIYTDAYLCDERNLQNITSFLKEIVLMIGKSQLPIDWELVLELSGDASNQQQIWSYYFVNHHTKTLFWLQDLVTDDFFKLGKIRGVRSKSHIQHQIQHYYWRHWEYFPHNREVPPEVIKELAGILIHAGIDSLTSPVSTSIYSEGELSKLLGFVKSLDFVDGNNGYAACVIGRLMSFYANARFINFHGQICARLSRDQSIYDEEIKPRSNLFMWLFPILFFAPNTHLRGLREIYTDQIICKHLWKSFMEKIQNEWQGLTLYSTVLLNTNMGFLAIPLITLNQSDPGPRSPSQICSYMSIVVTVGSILTGLLLTRHYHDEKESAADVDMFLQGHHTNGFAALAVLYSLPYSLLMWGITLFLIAFTFEGLDKTIGISGRIPLILIWIVVGILVIWCACSNRKLKWEVLHESVRSSASYIPGQLKKMFVGAAKSPAEQTDSNKEIIAWYLRPFSRRTGSSQSSTLVGHGIDQNQA